MILEKRVVLHHRNMRELRMFAKVFTEERKKLRVKHSPDSAPQIYSFKDLGDGSVVITEVCPGIAVSDGGRIGCGKPLGVETIPYTGTKRKKCDSCGFLEVVGANRLLIINADGKGRAPSEK